MAASQDGTASTATVPEEAPDAEWLRLTEGMDDYERFRFIARHVLLAAIDEARGYLTDERIFADLDDREERKAHLRRIDEQLTEDGALSDAEREFLCAALAEAMEALEMEASCPWRDLIRLAAASREVPASIEPSEPTRR